MKLKCFFLLLFLISCKGTKVYLEDNTKKVVDAFIRVGSGNLASWTWNDNYQIIKYGVVLKDKTFVLLDNNTYSLYYYPCDFQSDFGEWKIEDSILYTKSTFYVFDSLRHSDAYYSISNRNDSILIRFISNAMDGFIPTFAVYDSIGVEQYSTLLLDSHKVLKFSKNKVSSVTIRGWGTYHDSINIEPRDTVLLVIDFVPIKNPFVKICDLKSSYRYLKQNGVPWFIIDSVRITKKIFDGAKLLFSKPDGVKNDSMKVIYLDIEH